MVKVEQGDLLEDQFAIIQERDHGRSNGNAKSDTSGQSVGKSSRIP